MGSGNFLVRAIGFYNDAYDLFVMNIINVILLKQYGPETYTASKLSLVSTCVFVGSVVGQLVFGYYADILGRRRIMLITALLLIVGGFMCTFAYAPSASTTIIIIAISRCILGIGIGGEYPLSATVTSEGTSAKQRGKAVCSTFSMQGVGQLTAAIFGNILIQVLAPSQTEKYDSRHLEVIWRVLFGLGALPALFIFYPRLKMEENHHFQQLSQSKSVFNKTKVIQSSKPNNIVNSHFPTFTKRISFVCKYYGARLFGTSASWFLFDIIFYSQGIFSGTIMSSPAFGSASLQNTSLKLIFLAIAALPGYFVAISTIDIIGRKNMQLQGFFVMTILFSILGFFWKPITQNIPLFLILYALTFFFSNFGPNTTTFLLPVESFPTPLRATCHGFSAAMGKAGAALGTALFSFVKSTFGISYVFLFCSLIALLCIPLTWFFIEDRQGDLSLLDEELKDFIQKEKNLTDLEDPSSASIHSKDFNLSTIQIQTPLAIESPFDGRRQLLVSPHSNVK